MKKVWSVIISLVMALTIFAVPTFALEGDGTGADDNLSATEQNGDPDVNDDGQPVNPEDQPEGQDPGQQNDQENGNDGALLGAPEDEGEGDTTEFTVPAAPGPVTGLTGTPKITKKGVCTIDYSWKTVTGADGYAIARYTGALENEKYLDNEEATAYILKEFNNAPLKQRTYYTLHVIAYAKLDRQPATDEEKTMAKEAGAIIINPNGEYVMPSTSAVYSRVQTKSLERVERVKYDKGYKYYYYDKNGIDRGTSYSMWNTIKNKKSKSKYLIALDTRRNNVIIYEGKKGNWKVYKRFVCSCGTDGHRTPRGNFKILSKKPKFQTGDKVGKKVVRAKYTCWYATRIKGAIFFHSTLYYLNSKSRHAARHVGKHYSHGCIRLEIKNAKWIYNNCKKGTAVISRKYGKDCSYGYVYSYKY